MFFTLNVKFPHFIDNICKFDAHFSLTSYLAGYSNNIKNHFLRQTSYSTIACSFPFRCVLFFLSLQEASSFVIACFLPVITSYFSLCHCEERQRRSNLYSPSLQPPFFYHRKKRSLLPLCAFSCHCELFFPLSLRGASATKQSRISLVIATPSTARGTQSLRFNSVGMERLLRVECHPRSDKYGSSTLKVAIPFR